MANHTNPQIALICAQESVNEYNHTTHTVADVIVQRAHHFLAFLEETDAEIREGDPR